MSASATMQATTDSKQQQLALLRQQLHERRIAKQHSIDTTISNQSSTTETQVVTNVTDENVKVNSNLSHTVQSKQVTHTVSHHRPWSGFGTNVRQKSQQLSTVQITKIVQKLAADANVTLNTTVVPNQNTIQNTALQPSKQSIDSQRNTTLDNALGLDDTDIDSDDSVNNDNNSDRISRQPSLNNTYIPSQRPSITQSLKVDTSVAVSLPLTDTTNLLSPSYDNTAKLTQHIAAANKPVTAFDKLNPSPLYRKPNQYETELKLFVGTWNLHAKPVPHNLIDFIQPGYDIYCIGTEECENTIETSIIFNSKVNWCKHIQTVLGSEYIEISQQTLVAIHCIVYIKVQYAHLVSNIEIDSVSTGIGDVIGNKGGVAVSCNIGYTSLLFITSHFQAHQNNVVGRNNDFHKINAKLKNGSNDKQISASDRFDCVFWLGDLNYRVHANRSMADTLIQKSMLEVMLANDQLNHERLKQRVFNGFVEPHITFPPTYKFDADSNQYDSSKKQRVQSWTDRILYKPSDAVECIRYDSVRNIRSSDHRPVYATFKLRARVAKPPNQLNQSLTDQNGSQTCTIQ